MRRSSLAATAFAAEFGEPVDARAFLHVDDRPGRNGLMLVAAVEPASASPRARETAQQALAALRDAFAACPDPDPETALADGLAAANDVVLAANRIPGAPRILAGCTAVALSGEEARLVQAPPAQAILVRAGRLAAVPRLESWDPHWTGDPGPEAAPLGTGPSVHPVVVEARLSAGDLIVLAHSSLARCAIADRPVFDATLAAIRGGDPDAALDRLAELAAESAPDLAFAGAVRVVSLAEVRARPARAARSVAGPAVGARGGGFHGQARRMAPPPAPAFAAVAGDAAQAGLIDPVGHLRLALLGMVEAVRPRRQPAEKPAWKTAPPGADSISRFRGAGGLPQDVRSRLPRLPGLGAGGRAISAAAVLCLLLGMAGLGVGFLDWRSDRQAQAVAVLDDALSRASGGPAEALAMLEVAERALGSAESAGVAEDDLASRRAGVEAVRDQAWGIDRFAGMRRVGALPAGLAETEVKLLTAGVKAYLAGGGLYEVDAQTGQLVELLAPGQRIGDGVLGPIVDAAADRVGVIVSDGAAVYLQDGTGEWQRIPFGATPDVPGPPDGPTASFNRSLYSLDEAGSIIRYTQVVDRFEGAPWAAAGEYPDLADAVDISVDDRVHVLLEDGRVVSFYRGLLEMGSVAPVYPVVEGPAFLAANGGSLALYIVEPRVAFGDARGRVIRFDLGGATQQFAAPVGEGEDARLAMEALGRADQVAVSEPAGTLFFLAGDELWQATLPPLVGA